MPPGQFSSGTAERRYVAIVEGMVTGDEGTLRDVLVEERSLRVRPTDPSRPPPRGRRARIAITRYRVVERRADVTRVGAPARHGPAPSDPGPDGEARPPRRRRPPPRRAPGPAPAPVPSRHAARLPPSRDGGARSSSTAPRRPRSATSGDPPNPGRRLLGPRTSCRTRDAARPGSARDGPTSERRPPARRRPEDPRDGPTSGQRQRPPCPRPPRRSVLGASASPVATHATRRAPPDASARGCAAPRQARPARRPIEPAAAPTPALTGRGPSATLACTTAETDAISRDQHTEDRQWHRRQASASRTSTAGSSPSGTCGCRSGTAASSTATRCSTRRGPSGTAIFRLRGAPRPPLPLAPLPPHRPGHRPRGAQAHHRGRPPPEPPLLEPDDDYWVTQRVTRGLDPSDRADLRAVGADRDRRVPAAAAPRAGHALPRRHPRRRAVGAARAARQPQRPHQDEQLPQRGHGRPRGQGPRPRGLGHPPRREREPRRGHRQQRLPRARRRDLHAARAVRPARDQPGDGHRARRASSA